MARFRQRRAARPGSSPKGWVGSPPLSATCSVRSPAATPEVREVAFADLVASVVRHADTAASRTAAVWVEEPHGAVALSEEAGLWGASPDLAPSSTPVWRNGWSEIGDEIRTIGAERKGRAQVASIGLNVLGTSAILAVFVHTGGLTGAELGIGAATAVLNQKLLEAIFGEGNVAAFVNRARAGSTRSSTQSSRPRSSDSSPPSGRCAETSDLAVGIAAKPLTPPPGYGRRDSASNDCRRRRRRRPISVWPTTPESARELG